MNSIQGIVPGLPFRKIRYMKLNDDIFVRKIAPGNSNWLKQAVKYIKELITPKSCYKLMKSIDYYTLNKIHRNKICFSFQNHMEVRLIQEQVE